MTETAGYQPAGSVTAGPRRGDWLSFSPDSLLSSLRTKQDTVFGFSFGSYSQFLTKCLTEASYEQG